METSASAWIGPRGGAFDLKIKANRGVGGGGAPQPFTRRISGHSVSPWWRDAERLASEEQVEQAGTGISAAHVRVNYSGRTGGDVLRLIHGARARARVTPAVRLFLSAPR